jgi:hypothetical protein
VQHRPAARLLLDYFRSFTNYPFLRTIHLFLPTINRPNAQILLDFDPDWRNDAKAMPSAHRMHRHIISSTLFSIEKECPWNRHLMPT